MAVTFLLSVLAAIHQGHAHAADYAAGIAMEDVPGAPRPLQAQALSSDVWLRVEPEAKRGAVMFCYDLATGARIAGCTLVSSQRAIPYSGGHQHDDAQRPVGQFNPNSGISSDPDGTVPTVYTAPEVAGDIEWTVGGTDPLGRPLLPGTGIIWVGVGDLGALQADPSYVLIAPNADQNHPSNHFVTERTQRKIRSLVANYRRSFPNDPLLHLNDASLVRGGLFDLGANWSSQPRGHKTHRFGTDIDVRANEFYHDPSQSVPTSNYVDLMNTIAPRHGCNAQIHSGATPNEHFHLYCR